MSVFGSFSASSHSPDGAIALSSTLPAFHANPPCARTQQATNSSQHGKSANLGSGMESKRHDLHTSGDSACQSDTFRPPPYDHAALLDTLSRAPFKTYCDVGSIHHQKTLLRGHYEGLCDDDASHRQNTESFEYFDVSSVLHDSHPAARAEDAKTMAHDFSDVRDSRQEEEEEEEEEHAQKGASRSSVRDNNILSNANMMADTRNSSATTAVQQPMRRAIRVEPYHRSAAGKAVNVRTMRTSRALEKSMHFLVEHYLRHPHTALVFTDTFKMWHYLWDRLRGIRTTWIPQLPLTCSAGEDFVDASSGELLPMTQLRLECRRRVRWLEFTVAALSVGAAYLCLTREGCRRFVLSKKNFLESISQCFTDLAVSYRAEQRPRNAEFLSVLLLLYGLKQEVKAEDRALFCSFRQEVVNGLATLCAEPPGASVNLAQVYKELERQPRLAATRPVRIALQLLHCWSAREWDRFFYISRHGKLTTLQRCVVFQSFTYARFRAVLDLVLPNAYVYTKLRVRGVMLMSELAELLMMTESDCVAFVQHMGLSRLLDETERVLQLSNDRTESLVAAEEIEASCANKQNLLFPTDGCYLGFRVWHDMWRRFPDAPFCCHAAKSGAGRQEAKEVSARGSRRRRGDEADEADADEDDRISDEDRAGVGEEESSNTNDEGSLRWSGDTTACVTSSSAAGARALSAASLPSESVLLRRANCPVDWMCILEPYCPPYSADIRALHLVDAPEELFASIPAHRRAALRRCREGFHKATQDKDSRTADGATRVDSIPGRDCGAHDESAHAEEATDETAVCEVESLCTRSSVYSEDDLCLSEMEDMQHEETTAFLPTTAAETTAETAVSSMEAAAAAAAAAAEGRASAIESTRPIVRMDATSPTDGASVVDWAPWLATVAEARALRAEMLRNPLYAALNRSDPVAHQCAATQPSHKDTTTTTTDTCAAPIDAPHRTRSAEEGAISPNVATPAAAAGVCVCAVRPDSGPYPQQPGTVTTAPLSASRPRTATLAQGPPRRHTRLNAPHRTCDDAAKDRHRCVSGEAGDAMDDDGAPGGAGGLTTSLPPRAAHHPVRVTPVPDDETHSCCSVPRASVTPTVESPPATPHLTAPCGAAIPPQPPQPPCVWPILSATPAEDRAPVTAPVQTRRISCHATMPITRSDSHATHAAVPAQTNGATDRTTEQEEDDWVTLAPHTKPHDTAPLSSPSQTLASAQRAGQEHTGRLPASPTSRVRLDRKTAPHLRAARGDAPPGLTTTPSATAAGGGGEDAMGASPVSAWPRTAESLPTPSSVSCVSSRSSHTYTESRSRSENGEKEEEETESRTVYPVGQDTPYRAESAVHWSKFTPPSAPASASLPPCVTTVDGAVTQAVARYLTHVWELLVHGRSLPYVPCGGVAARQAAATATRCSPPHVHRGCHTRGSAGATDRSAYSGRGEAEGGTDGDGVGDLDHTATGGGRGGATRAAVRLALADALIDSTICSPARPAQTCARVCAGRYRRSSSSFSSSCAVSRVRGERRRLAHRLCRGFALALLDTRAAEAQSATAAALAAGQRAPYAVGTGARDGPTMGCRADDAFRYAATAPVRHEGEPQGCPRHRRYEVVYAPSSSSVSRWVEQAASLSASASAVAAPWTSSLSTRPVVTNSTAQSTVQLSFSILLMTRRQGADGTVADATGDGVADAHAANTRRWRVWEQAVWRAFGIDAAVWWCGDAGAGEPVTLRRVGAQHAWRGVRREAAAAAAAEAETVLTSVYVYTAATPMPEQWCVPEREKGGEREGRCATKRVGIDAAHESPTSRDTCARRCGGDACADACHTLSADDPSLEMTAEAARFASVTMVFCLTCVQSLKEVMDSVTSSTAGCVAGVLLLLAVDHDEPQMAQAAVTNRFWRLYDATRGTRVRQRSKIPAATAAPKRRRWDAFRQLGEQYNPTPAAAWQRTNNSDSEEYESEYEMSDGGGGSSSCGRGRAGERPVLVVMPCRMQEVNKAVGVGMAALLEAYRMQIVQRCRSSDTR